MAQTERKGLSGLDKVLIGCGLGCAGLVVLAVLSVAFGTMWLVTPGRQAETEAVAGPDSLGVVRLHELADDPGTQELFVRVLERLEESNRQRQREDLPPSMRWLSELQSQQSNPAGLNMFIPREMTIALEHAADGEGVDYVAAFNPRTMVRGLKTFFGLVGRADDAGEVRSDHRGHPIYRLEDDAHLAFVRSTVLFSSSHDAVTRAIDRLETAAETPGGDASRPAPDRRAMPDGDWDLEGVVDNDTGLIASFLEPPTTPDPALESAGDEGLVETAGSEDLRLGFGFDIVSADELTGRTVLDCGDREAAERWSQALESRYQAMREKAAARGLELEVAGRVDGARVVTDLRLVGLEELLVEALTFEEETEESED